MRSDRAPHRGWEQKWPGSALPWRKELQACLLWSLPWGPSGDCDHASFILYLLSLEGFMAQNRYSKLLKKWGPCENSDSYTVIPWYLEQKGQLWTNPLLCVLVCHLLYCYLDIYPREQKTYVHRKTRIWMFTAILFKIAPKWIQPKCPSTDEWINKMWYSPRWTIIQSKRE